MHITNPYMLYHESTYFTYIHAYIHAYIHTYHITSKPRLFNTDIFVMLQCLCYIRNLHALEHTPGFPTFQM